MKQQWDNWVAKFDSISLRERGLIFFAIALLIISLVNKLFIDPLLAKQKSLSEHMVHQQEKIKEVRATMEALLQAKINDANSPLRKQLNLAKQRIGDSDAYMQNLRGRLVAPEQMANLLQQVLKKNGQLELVNLQSLPVEPLIAEKTEGAKTAPAGDTRNQVFTHRVKLTVRGTYADLLQYLTTLEHLPTQMFWGMAKMEAEHPPTAELTLTLYTLSLDKTWLQI